MTGTDMSKTEKSDWTPLPPDMGSFIFLPLVALVVMMLSNIRGSVFVMAYYIGLGVSFVGAGFLLVARWPMYRQGKFLHFGAASLPPASSKYYRIAYVLLIPSCVFLILLLVASSFWRRG